MLFHIITKIISAFVRVLVCHMHSSYFGYHPRTLASLSVHVVQLTTRNLKKM